MSRANQTVRKRVKRRAANIWCKLQDAATYIILLSEDFENGHPELAKELTDMLPYIAMLQLYLESFYEKCWGKLPEDWNKARTA